MVVLIFAHQRQQLCSKAGGKIIAGGKKHQLFRRFVWRLAVVVANRATRERRRAWRAASHPAPSIVGP
jgi:hypothetical protein